MSDNPADWKTWQDVSAKEQNLIDSLLDQWRQLVGYQVMPPDWALLAMATERVSSMFDMGQFMARHARTSLGMDPGAYFVAPELTGTPGAMFGITKDQFYNKLTQYQSFMEQYTGTGGDLTDFNNLMVTNGGEWDVALATERLLHDPEKLKTYGWLKYGLNYDQFQQQKTQMRQQFGFELDDKQAVAQLQYYHQASSAQFAAHAQPTFTQQEKKQANVGLTGGGAAIR